MKVIVGNRQQAFATATEAMTLTEFLQSPCPTSKTIAIGQGLSLAELDCVKQHCAQHNLELLPAVDPANRAGRSVTHKHNSQLEQQAQQYGWPIIQRPEATALPLATV